MARSAKVPVENENTGEDPVAFMQVSEDQGQESLEETIIRIQEAIERYLEVLAAEESEDRLSR